MGAIRGVRSFEGLRDRSSVVWTFWRRRLKPKRSRKATLATLDRESDRALRDLIRRWQARPVAKRTMFLRKRIAPGRTVLQCAYLLWSCGSGGAVVCTWCPRPASVA
jgi:hypothetical protein